LPIFSQVYFCAIAYRIWCAVCGVNYFRRRSRSHLALVIPRRRLMWLLASHPFALGLNTASVIFLLGAFLMGLGISWHFGKVRAQHEANCEAL